MHIMSLVGATVFCVVMGHSVMAQPGVDAAAGARTVAGLGGADENQVVPLDINVASEAELGRVRFIGRKRAAAIVSGRPWQHPDDLVAKKVVPAKVYSQIREQLVAR